MEMGMPKSPMMRRALGVASAGKGAKGRSEGQETNMGTYYSPLSQVWSQKSPDLSF